MRESQKGEVVVRVILSLPKGARFKSNKPIIKLFFYKKSKEEKYKKLLSYLNFSTNKIVVGSEEVDRELDRVLFCGMMECIGINYDYIISLHRNDDDPLIAELAEQLYKELECWDYLAS